MKWSNLELDILKDIASRKAWHEILTRLPGRTIPIAQCQARYYGYSLTTRVLKDWTTDEIDFLLKHRNLSDLELAEALNRTIRAVNRQRYRVGATIHHNLNLQLGETVWAYIAGFFDGEGWVGFDFHQGKGGWLMMPHLCISNTNQAVILFLKEKFNLQTETKIIHILAEHRYSENHQVHFQFAVRGRQRVQAILEGMLPFLIVKQPDAQFVLKYIKNHQFGTCASYKEVKDLYEFRLTHHFHGDKRRALTTKKLEIALANWPQSQ